MFRESLCRRGTGIGRADTGKVYFRSGARPGPALQGDLIHPSGLGANDSRLSTRKSPPLSVSVPPRRVGSWLHNWLTLLFREKPACQAWPISQAPAAYHILNDFVLPVLPLHFQQVVAEVEQVKATLLAQQDDDGATGPVQAVTKALPGSRRGSSWRERQGGVGRALA